LPGDALFARLDDGGGLGDGGLGGGDKGFTHFILVRMSILSQK
jgi:hypothetical protein